MNVMYGLFRLLNDNIDSSILLANMLIWAPFAESMSLFSFCINSRDLFSVIETKGHHKVSTFMCIHANIEPCSKLTFGRTIWKYFTGARRNNKVSIISKLRKSGCH